MSKMMPIIMSDQEGSGYFSEDYVKRFLVVFILVIFTFALPRLCRYLRLRKEQEQAAGRGILGTAASAGRMGQQPHAALPSVEMRVGDGPLLCTYRRADGWRQATCPVCLSNLADGETLRVLHYFHVACINKWLRRGTTCPLCRAAPDSTTM